MKKILIDEYEKKSLLRKPFRLLSIFMAIFLGMFLGWIAEEFNVFHISHSVAVLFPFFSVIILAIIHAVDSYRQKSKIIFSAFPGTKTGEVISKIDPIGKVRIGGEVWNAKSRTGNTIDLDSKIKVISRENMELIVEEIPDGGSGKVPPTAK